MDHGIAAANLHVDEIIRELVVDPAHGLSADEASARLERYGPNELRAAETDPAWRRLLRQFVDPLIYLLLAAIGISLVAWFLEGAHGAPIDAIVIAVIVIANAVIGFVQEGQAADAVAALSDMTATHSTVLRDGRLADVPSAELVPGDVLVLSEGDAVGADARLFTATSLQVQESSLTGESAAVEKDTLVLPEGTRLGDRSNMVFKGTGVARGVGRAVVTGTGMSTEMGRIATLLDETESEPSPLQKEISQISKTLGLLVVGIAVLVMVVLALINGVSSFSEAVEILLLGVSLAVAAVPEGLPAILSLVLAIGVRALASRNAVMKDLHSTETLGSVSVIASDKTGTLTRNEMTIREIVTASGSATFEGTGYNPAGGVQYEGDAGLVAEETRRVLAAGALANNAQLDHDDATDTWSIQGDPTEAAFLVAQHKVGEALPAAVDAVDRVGEVPFDSNRKLMSVLGEHNGTQRIITKGAPEVLIGRCVSEQIGEEIVELTEARREEWAQVVVRLSEQGYRTLGAAWREAEPEHTAVFDEDDEHDLVFLGVAGIIDLPREESAGAIAQARAAGITVVMITGDHPVTARRIALDLGIMDRDDPARVMTGEQVAELSDEELARRVPEVSVYARVSPEDKLRIIDALQANGETVSMTGDGVNDAPALKSADIGIAMGITGTEVTKQAATMVLGDDNYSTIVSAVRQGRVIFDNIKKFMRYLLSSNMGEVSAVFLGVVLGGVINLADPSNPAATVVPLLATQILWINLVTDSAPALAMGVDPEIDDVMARSPRRRDERVIDRHMWGRIISVGLFMGFVTLLVYDLALPGGLVSGLEVGVPMELQFDTARTMVFTSLVMMQLFNALNSRSDLNSAFSHLFTNKWLWFSLAFGVVAQVVVVEVPFLQEAFGTTSLDSLHWLVAVGAGASILVFEEIVKAVRRARSAR
ncbi:MAG: cation-translocating P-type ATPase [Ruaniaceae bacterium]|nr:cation-translocating P-type ATPase [Ruaniaceae bacterium]